MSSAYRCNLCVGYQAVSLRQLLNHMSRNHKSDPNFHVLCGIDGCARTYRVFFSFRNHIVHKHSLAYNTTVSDHEAEQDVNLNGEFPGPEQPGEQEDIADIAEEPFDIANEGKQLQRASALSILQFKEKGRVPQTVVDLFVKNNTELVQNVVDVLKLGVKNRLSASGLDIEAIPGLNEIFNDDSTVRSPFNGLENERQQHQFYLDNLGLVVSSKLIQCLF